MSREIELLKDRLLISKTNEQGYIIYANEEFCKIAGYTVQELIHEPHNIIRHPDMPKWAFQNLWETVKKGEVWEGFVKNSTKDGDYYWVFARVYPIENREGRREYMSVRIAIDKETSKKYEKLYKENFNSEPKNGK